MFLALRPRSHGTLDSFARGSLSRAPSFESVDCPEQGF